MLGKGVLLLLVVLFHADASIVTPKILGGTDVLKPNYVVSVQYLGEHICGGVIYKTDHVITAAQCVDGKEPKGITIRQNSINHNKGGEIRYVSEVHKHPDYDEDLRYNDLAILKVRELQQPAEVITLIVRNSTAETAKLQIYGWGTTRDDDEALSNTLKKFEVAFYDRQKCKTEMGSLSINERMICSMIGVKGENPCHGYEGGPLMKMKQLYGIFSWNRKCDMGSSVYTYIFEYLDWIKTITENNA